MKFFCLIAGTTGLFGNIAGNTGGIFGQGGGLNPSTTTQNLQGNLFGGQSANQQNNQKFGGEEGVNISGSGQTGTQFGGQAANTTQAGSLFGGQPAVTTQTGSLFGGQPTNASQTGGLFGGQPANIAQTGSLFGGQSTNTTQTSSVFGGQPAKTAQTGGLFGGQSTNTTQTGGVFGGQPANTTQTGLFVGQPVTVQTGSLFSGKPISNTTTVDQQQINLSAQQGFEQNIMNNLMKTGFPNMVCYLESQTDITKRIDEESELRWSSQIQEGVGHYYIPEREIEADSAYSFEECKSFYGNSKQKKMYDQFKSHALRGEKQKKEQMKKVLSLFTSKEKTNNSVFNQQQSNQEKQTRISQSNTSSKEAQNSKNLLQQMDLFIDFIKQGTQSRIKIPLKTRYTVMDVKTLILQEHLPDEIDQDNVKNFRLHARLKGGNRAPRVLLESDNIFTSSRVPFQDIDFIELVEKSQVQHVFQDSLVLSPTDQTEIMKKRVIIPKQFVTDPSIKALNSLSEAELANVQNFCIENDNVKIVFQEPVNLVDIDLSNLLLEETKISLEKVPLCDRINKKSVVTFKKFGLKQLKAGKSKTQVISLVEKLVSKMNLDLLQPYDIDSTSLIFRQQNFDQFV